MRWTIQKSHDKNHYFSTVILLSLYQEGENNFLWIRHRLYEYIKNEQETVNEFETVPFELQKISFNKVKMEKNNNSTDPRQYNSDKIYVRTEF